jgi:glycosyltransferase involved in cell wall biosynthesis
VSQRAGPTAAGADTKGLPLELAVIVPCRNVERTLGEALDALMHQVWAGSWELIIVDNGSTDGTARLAQTVSQGRTRVISANERSGVAFARNTGVRATSARSVAFCDGDDVVHAGWVEAMGEALRHHPLVSGPVDPWLLNPQWLAAARASPTDGSLPTFGVLPFARGNNCGVHRGLWRQLGGFDENFRGLEDVEFSLRARALGVEPHFVPGATVAYRHRAALSEIWRQGRYYGVGRPALRSVARSLGQPEPRTSESIRSWIWLAVHLPTLRHRRGRYRSTWVLANRVGVIEGRLEEFRQSLRLSRRAEPHEGRSPDGE